MADTIIVLSSDDEESGAIYSKPKSQELTNQSAVIEKRDVSGTENKFEEFVTLCHRYIKPDDANGLRIMKRIQKKYEEAPLLCTCSREFLSLLEDCLSKLALDPSNVFVYVKNINDELGAWNEETSKSCSSENTSSRDCCETSELCENSSTRSVDNGCDFKRQKHIKKLEKLLRAIHKKICRLQEKELSFDDLDEEDSAYVREEQYKRRFLKVWNKLCELKGRDSTTGRYTEKKFLYKGCKYSEINKKITKFINRYKEFPDFPDILNLVTKVSTKQNLRLSPSLLHETAKSVFIDVGEMLRSKRLQDFQDLFGSHLTDGMNTKEDPALQDSEMAKKLNESRVIGTKKMEELFQFYVEKQAKRDSIHKKVNDDNVVGDSSDKEMNGDSNDNEEEEEEEEQEGEEGGDEADEDKNNSEDEEAKISIGDIAEEFKDEVDNDCDDTEYVDKSSSETELESSDECSDDSSDEEIVRPSNGESENGTMSSVQNKDQAESLESNGLTYSQNCFGKRSTPPPSESERKKACFNRSPKFNSSSDALLQNNDGSDDDVIVLD